MYQSHWGLQESPFHGCIDPDRFYKSPTHEEALARLHFIVEQRRRMGILLGHSGSGKSLLLEVFAAQLRRQGIRATRISLRGIEPEELLEQLACNLQLNPKADATRATLWRMVTDRLTEYRYQQTSVALLLDDADEAERSVLSMVVRLAAFDSSPQSCLTIVLSSQPHTAKRIGPQLLNLCQLRIDVEPWQTEDIKDYLNTSLAQAGRKDTVFDEPAVERLHELSHGIPRRVSQLADLSLLAAAGAELAEINAEVVEAVNNELSPVEV